MINRINAQRAAHGLMPLRENVQLGHAAAKHAADLASAPWLIDTGRWHEGSNGSTIRDRIVAEGYIPEWYAENVGWGWGGDGDAMMDYWMNSPSHRDAILDPRFDEVGVGYLYAPGSMWGHYWSTSFGKRKGTPQPPQPPAPTYTSHVPVVLAGAGAVTLDLLPYLRGDGRTYRVGNARGTYELFQTQSEGSAFYQVKSWDDQSFVPWEGFTYDNEYIRRDVDCSPGGGRFYRQFGAPWVKRHMSVGETFTQGKRLQFYQLDSCVPIDQYSGDVVDTIKLVAHHRSYTFKARDWPPVTLDDVVELEWVQGGEVYLYARNYGLCGWARRHQDVNSPQWSAISEMRPDVGMMDKLAIPCVG